MKSIYLNFMNKVFTAIMAGSIKQKNARLQGFAS